MGEVTTCEQYVLAELSKLKGENEFLVERLSELGKETHRDVGEVSVSFGGPVETIQFSVASSYTLRHYEIVTADEAREILANERRLEEFAGTKVGYYGDALDLETREWPFSLEVGESVYACDIDGHGELEVHIVCQDQSGFEAGTLYPARLADEVRAEGLGELAEELSEFVKRAEAEDA